jgi:uncharacterized protein (UPF0332 family)
MIDPLAIELSGYRLDKAKDLLSQTKILDKRFSKIAHQAFDARQDNDYEDFYVPEEIESADQIKNVEIFIQEIERKINLLRTGDVALPQIDAN